MTVIELISFLQQFPSEAEIMISTYACGTDHRYPYDTSRISFDKDTGTVIFEAEDN